MTAATARRLGVALVVGLCAIATPSRGQEVPGVTRTRAGDSVPAWFRWGPERPDLLRYNRVEGFSIGVRAAVRPEVLGRPLSVVGTARLGHADRVPDLRLDLERVSLGRTVSLGLYHELVATEPAGRTLGIANSVMAGLLGRDDGDYYRSTGIALAWAPGPSEWPLFRVSLHSERHAAAEVGTRASLARLWEDEGWAFRSNVEADEGWEHALSLTLSPTWGTDPARVHGALRVNATAAVGDHAHARAGVEARVDFPVGGDVTVGVAGGGGVATSGVPAQRAASIGGHATVRGYVPRSQVGPCAAHARTEVSRTLPFGGVSMFGDAGWAGPCGALRLGEALTSVGLGLSMAGGAIRADLAWALDAPRSRRIDLVLDGPG